MPLSSGGPPKKLIQEPPGLTAGEERNMRTSSFLLPASELFHQSRAQRLRKRLFLLPSSQHLPPPSESPPPTSFCFSSPSPHPWLQLWASPPSLHPLGLSQGNLSLSEILLELSLRNNSSAFRSDEPLRSNVSKTELTSSRKSFPIWSLQSSKGHHCPSVAHLRNARPPHPHARASLPASPTPK